MSTALTCYNALKQEDGVVAFPTDTVWGLGCLPNNKSAIDRIYHLKGRDENKPLILLGTHWQDFAPFINTSGISDHLRQNVCVDGQVTVVFPATSRVPESIHRGLNTIGCRVPDCAPLHELLQQIPGHVLATTSANPSGHPPAESAEEVQHYFAELTNQENGAILSANDFVSQGTPSTVLSVGPNDAIKIFRQGDFILPEGLLAAIQK